MEVTGSANSVANCFQIQVGILSGAMALKVPRQSSFSGLQMQKWWEVVLEMVKKRAAYKDLRERGQI